jgi:hypothetical protein
MSEARHLEEGTRYVRVTLTVCWDVADSPGLKIETVEVMAVMLGLR